MISVFYYVATYMFFNPNSDDILWWFWHKIAECLMITFTSFMPISYILWIHSQTYNRMIIQSQVEETLTLAQYRRRDKHETVVPLSAFDLASAYESSSQGAHLSGQRSVIESQKANLMEQIQEEQVEEVKSNSPMNSHQTSPPIKDGLKYEHLNESKYAILRGGGSQALDPIRSMDSAQYREVP